jgi:RHS repeat-associated protein
MLGICLPCLSRVTYACSDWTGTVCASTDHEFRYEYDGEGNLTRFDKWKATTSQVETVRYVINGANQIACIDADASKTCNGSETLWQYDSYGNLKNDGTNTYEYDAANRLSAVGTTTYTYNGDGDHISQTVSDGTSPVTTTYVLDTATPLTMVLSETNGTTTTRYWHALDTLAQSDGTTTDYFAYDGLGSVRQLVDASGSVGLAQTFDPYGNGYARAGSAQSALGYSGEQTDSNGFVFLRARYYQPSMGRFTQMDPSRAEKNPYQYSLSNPVLSIDPAGYLAYHVTQHLSSPCAANPPMPTPIPYPITGFEAVEGTEAFVEGDHDAEGVHWAIHPSDIDQNYLPRFGAN